MSNLRSEVIRIAYANQDLRRYLLPLVTKTAQKKYTQTELDEVIRLHGLWLDRKEGGVQADLSFSDLRRLNFRGVDLRESFFAGCNFNRADLRNADFRGADLVGSRFIKANVEGMRVKDSYFKNINDEGAIGEFRWT